MSCALRALKGASPRGRGAVGRNKVGFLEYSIMNWILKGMLMVKRGSFCCRPVGRRGG